MDAESKKGRAMLGEVVKMLESAAKAQAKPTVTVHPDERLRKSFVVMPDGQVDEKDWRLPNYDRVALSLNGLVDVAARSPEAFRKGVQFCVSDESVTVVLDDCDERRHRVRLETPASPIMEYLSIDEDEDAWLDQEAMCRMLRTEVRSSMPSTIASQLAALKFKRTIEAEAAVEPAGRNARSLSTLEEMATPDGGKVGETVDLEVRVSPDLMWRENATGNPERFQGLVGCTLRINYAKAALALRPVGGELERLRSDARRWVMARIGDGLIGTGLAASIVEACP